MKILTEAEIAEMPTVRLLKYYKKNRWIGFKPEWWWGWINSNEQEIKIYLKKVKEELNKREHIPT